MAEGIKVASELGDKAHGASEIGERLQAFFFAAPFGLLGII